MAEINRQTISESGLTPTLSSAASGGDSFKNTGREFLFIKNADASVHTVTVAAQDSTVSTEQYGKLTKNDAEITVAAGKEGFIGPFPPSVFNSNGQASITYDGVASLSIAVVTI